MTAGSIYTKDYTYAVPYGTAGTTTGLVSGLTYQKPNGTEIAGFTYSYDSMGRIISDGTYHYSYDSLGQLASVTDNAGSTVESYLYDGAGNILSTVKNGETHSYGYNDTGWTDLLISYDGQSITYDEIGNPENYLGSTLTWQNGRELETFTNSEYSITYSYDVNGLRTEKAVTQSGVTTVYSYIYNGSTLLQDRIGNNTVLNFIYTADGKPYALEYSTNNGSSYATYYYLTNLQGDVISILNSNSTAVVSYSYDSWGKITQTAGTLANTLGKDNPLRYRGYFLDEETGLYYLQSRYYDPQIGRFINADGYASTGQGFIGSNMFAYCGNAPIIRNDSSGFCYYDQNGNWCHDNWEYLDGYIRYDEPIDITDQLNSAMEKHAQELQQEYRENGYASAALMFYQNVKSGRKWDLKSQQEWNLSPDKLYSYNQNILRYDDPGNIHYGYVGSVLFPKEVLLIAAGLYQLREDTSKISYWNSNFDDPHDQWAIAMGCDIWR